MLGGSHSPHSLNNGAACACMRMCNNLKEVTAASVESEQNDISLVINSQRNDLFSY